MSKILISISISNGGPASKAVQEFDLPKPVKDQQISALEDKAVRAAAEAVGVKIPKVKRVKL